MQELIDWHPMPRRITLHDGSTATLLLGRGRRPVEVIIPDEPADPARLRAIHRARTRRRVVSVIVARSAGKHVSLVDANGAEAQCSISAGFWLLRKRLTS